MTVLERYFASEIIRSVLFALLAFLSLFAFFDLMGELQEVGHNGYMIQHAMLFVLLGMPGYVYELMPIATLIGTIFTLAQLAARSEFTIMRVSSLSTVMAAKILAKIGVLFMLVTLLFGELLAPKSSELAEKVRLQAQGASVSQQFRSGLWTKDQIRADGVTGAIVGTRFFNAQTITPAGRLEGVRLYELDNEFHLARIVTARTGDYLGKNTWQLNGVTETSFADGRVQREITAPLVLRNLPKESLVSEITPEILSVLFSDPDRMSAYDLLAYTRHLKANNQRTERYEIAFWKKLIYPLSVFVMMAMALPFAYLHFRAGGVSLKIFTGIMIGVSFLLVNNLFAHLGLLNTWSPFLTATLPSLFFLAIAAGTLNMVDRHR
ncbi:LPS export ABC transporter permease LptG [Oxalobacteraceae bacterium CAVE-383]|nr:LPS export ABC transporter permease LptG [Oxalobacteraceae bacterium CAVE-383]